MPRQPRCRWMVPKLYSFMLLSLLLALPPRHAPLAAPAVGLAVQPQRRSATTVVEVEIEGIVLHVWMPGAGDHDSVCIHVVLLLRRIALNVKDEFLARLQILRAPLFL